MGEIFDQLLLGNELLTKEELEHYKKILAANPEKKHLGELLLERGLIESHVLEQLMKAEQERKKQAKLIRKQKRDKKLLEIIQRLGIVTVKDIAACLREQNEVQSRGQTVFLADLLLAKGYLTKYLIQKFCQKEPVAEKDTLEPNQEELILDIPNYLRDRFLGKIAIKNQICTKEELSGCWSMIKKYWPNKGLAEIMASKNLITEAKLKVLLAVLKKTLPLKYPYFDAQIRDIQMAKMLVKKNFLSPWRLNKCLLQQLTIIKKKQYVSLRQILVDQSYLSNYIFDTVLKQYGALVSCDPPGFLVPAEEVHVLQKEELAKAIQEAHSDVHLIIEEEDMSKINLSEEFLRSAEVMSEIVEVTDSKSKEASVEVELVQTESAPKPEENAGDENDSGEIMLSEFEPSKEKMLTPDRITLIPEEEVENQDFLDIDVEDEELDIDLCTDAKEVIAEDLSDVEEKLGTVHRRVGPLTESQECNEDDLANDLEELEKQKKQKKT